MAEGRSCPRIKTHSILTDFDVFWNQKLGTGISGPVRPCVKKSSKERFALKCILDNPRSRTEVNLHVMCSGHPNVVQVLDVYANDLQLHDGDSRKPYLLMVLELMEGGELFDRISKEQKFTERKAAMYLKQVADAVRHCHDLNVAHRDLKPENLLLKDNTEDAQIKLSDFGFAKIDDGNLQTPYFTPYYVAPQILVAHRHQTKIKMGLIPTSKPYTYDKSCDMWSLGVILYIMLSGYPPFYSETPSRQITTEMKRKILLGDYQFPETEWQQVSEEAKSVVKSLLHTDPSCRMTVYELLSHIWLTNAPETKLSSPAVFSDKEGLADINLAHSQQLTAMRIPDCPLTLKSIAESENPIIRKRKYRQSNVDDSTCQDCIKKPTLPPASLKSLRDIIAYCILPPKVDDDENVLNDLVAKCLEHNSKENGFHSILSTWNWDGKRFDSKVDKSQLAHLVSELVQTLTRGGIQTEENGVS
ncbi:hypothetical protein ACJMK2_012108 [Sinanodonta woodiana]|uniref:non-specific serine/threonine protein kinase n=1 Tax=Sinanodonta woodiana TaxID=1069815 RepID=A0ABD3VA86_SINWO